MSSEDARWKALSGLNNWEGLLDPLASDLRPYLIHYGSMVAAISDAFINEPASKNIGLSRYARRNLLAKTGVVKANPLSKYEVTKYFYSPSTFATPIDSYYVKPTRDDAVLKESNWMGYVAVATDEGKSVLGRRDILIAWRGTIRDSEWDENKRFLNLINAPLIFGENSAPLVHLGWYNMYTSINEDSVLKHQSARDQIRCELESLIEKYKGEEISITTAGHSLGASLATLTAVDLAANPFDKDILVTAFLYASPKVGEVNFVNAFSALENLRALRISNNKDIVPGLPPLGFDPDNNIVFYREVGVGFAINTKESEYIKEDASDLLSHDLMVYLHGIDGFIESGGGFKPHGDFGITELNKYNDLLNEGDDNYYAPVAWWIEKNKGMVQQDDGTWILDDHEIDDTF